MAWRGVLGGLLIVGIGACTGGASTPGSPNSTPSGGSSGSGTTGPTPCSPLEGADVPITLEQVVGAGKHPDGTIYVLDEGRPEYRAFVSDGGVLQRKPVSGSGTGSDWTVATIADPNAPFTLKIESSGGVATRMGVYRGELRAKDFDIGTEGDVLELLQPSAYASLPVRNLPPEVVVEYDASTTDGHRIVVLRPATDWSYEDFRLFYGTAASMIERPVTNVSRGSSTHITFTMDGLSHDAFFPSSLSGQGLVATLTTNGATQQLTVLGADAGSPGAGLSFFCL